MNDVQPGDWRTRYLLECIPQISWMARADGCFECGNGRCLEFTGLNLEQLRGSGWRSVVHPEDLGRWMVHWQAAVRVGEPYRLDYRLRRRDGVYRWHLLLARPVYDGDGLVIRWFGTCTDIHRYKLLELSVHEREIGPGLSDDPA
ncbi:PAS domain-containing protein [Gloeobacter violaceus]|uniref:histidine kinase n=1 Tax=Gloeobacter violaceus (strain ATCC 29082 / PCC 7421) TaxID=251221 RepID=Q7NF07_GLOVI|nr:PAS domain-containing protein [Gloeobacter violaceus]BAC91661.1 gll3720 [Gloeobacter violaceus PCC 7421]